MSEKPGKAAIVTVHGTGDTAEGPAGQKWYQQGSPFAQRLLGHLQQQGVNAEIIPHLWSGANSAWDRERAADKLADRIRKLYDKYDSIHVIGHSHGGNVANDAAVLLKWGLRRNAVKEKFDSLTTVGTPFLDSRTGFLQMAAGLLFVAITWGSVLALVFMTLFAVSEMILAPVMHAARVGGPVRLNWEAIDPVLGPAHAEVPVLPLIAFALLGVCLVFMFRLSRQGVRRILRPRTGGRTKTSVLSIWHENDEAIAFLQRVEELQLEPFPRGSLFRGSRSAAISVGVLGVILIGVVAPLLYVAGVADVFDFTNSGADDDIASNNVAVALIGLFFAPLIFTAVYLIYRYLVGGMQEIAVRGAMNGYVAGVLRGVAMGRDGDQVLCNVAPRSHTHRTHEVVLTGDCADRMKDGAQGAAGKLIDKYRWALFSVGGDSSASLTSLTTDAMTWDSLIHTTYFDQPEVAAAIADHIARTIRESAHSAAPERAAPAPAPAAAPEPVPQPVAVAPQPAQPPAAPRPPPELPPDAAPQPA
jgi:hypothetical protein